MHIKGVNTHRCMSMNWVSHAYNLDTGGKDKQTSRSMGFSSQPVSPTLETSGK